MGAAGMGMAWLLYAVFAAGTAAALFAFFWGRRLKREGRRIPEAVRLDPDFAELLSAGCAAGGDLELEAPSARAVLEILALNLRNPLHHRHSAWGHPLRKGRVEILERGQQQLRFTGIGLYIGEGKVRLEPGSTAGHWRARWALQVPSARSLATWGQLWALVIALPASVAVPAYFFLHVLNSPFPAVSAQLFQVLQTFQVVWEPHLFLGIASARVRLAGSYLETLIASAAFEAQTGRRADAPTAV